LILLDSTAIVAFLDADDAFHETSVAALKGVIGSYPLAASVISYAEVMTGVALGHHPRESVNGFFEVIVRELLPVDQTIAARAATLRGKRRSLSMPDALILATADLHADVERIICADGDWPKVKDLRVNVELLEVTPPRARGPGTT
jgi:predicted nucleic acid-binding protein